MYALFDLFLDICLLRKGPQDVPLSPVLLKLSLVVYGLTSLLVLLVFSELFSALLQALVDLALLAGLTHAILTSARYSMRFVQTLTALAGAGALLGVVALPVFFWMHQEAERDGAPILPWLLFLGLVVWNIAVMAHVLHHALSANRWVGVMYALVYLIVSLVVMDFLFPVE